MLIIPVIDLLNGEVVHAKKGARHNYQAVNSCLTNSAVPDDIIKAYFELYPFTKMYIADLDAIQGNGNHYAWIDQLACAYPACEFWLDAGIQDLQNPSPYPQQKNIRSVIGSENSMDKEDFAGLCRRQPEPVLSLDFIETGLTDNHWLLDEGQAWPRQIVVMMLSRVGTGMGIDWDILRQVQQLADGRQIHAAGGISDREDLNRLGNFGLAGALIATALHDGSISAVDIAELDNQ